MSRGLARERHLRNLHSTDDWLPLFGSDPTTLSLRRTQMHTQRSRGSSRPRVPTRPAGRTSRRTQMHTASVEGRSRTCRCALARRARGARKCTPRRSMFAAATCIDVPSHVEPIAHANAHDAGRGSQQPHMSVRPRALSRDARKCTRRRPRFAATAACRCPLARSQRHAMRRSRACVPCLVIEEWKGCCANFHKLKLGAHPHASKRIGGLFFRA